MATIGLAAAAAVLAAAVVGTVVARVDSSGRNQPVARSAVAHRLVPVGAEPISGWVSLTSVGWGTRLDLTCAYAGSGYAEAGTSYTMVIRRPGGSLEQVASWQSLPGRKIHLMAATSTPLSRISDVEIRAGAKTVLRLHLS